MRNDIKRFFVAVLAACGLAVSAALAAPSYQARLTVQGSAYDATPGGNADQSVRYDGSDAPVGGARTTSKGWNAELRTAILPTSHKNVLA